MKPTLLLRLTIVLLLTINGLKSYGQDANAEHYRQLKALSDKNEASHKLILDKWTEPNILGPGKVYLACDLWPGPTRKCKIHHKQCCPGDCEKKYAADIAIVDEGYNKEVARLNMDYKIAQQKAADEKARLAKEAADEKARLAKEAADEKARVAKEKTEEKAKQDKADADAKKAGSKSSADKAADKSSADKDHQQTTTYVESAEARDMRLRADGQRKRDEGANESMGTAMGVTAGAMGALVKHNIFNEDKDNDFSTYLKGNIGLGLQEIPVVNNMLSSGKPSSTSTTTSNYCLNASLLFAFLNNTFVSFKIDPYFNYGINAFSSGISGNHTSYGSGATIGLGKAFKLLLRGAYENRTGSMTEDDAVLGINVTGSTNYNYNTLKYGGGLYWAFGELHDSFVQVAAYKEDVSFLKGTGTQVLSYEAKLSVTVLALSVQYAPNYPIAGDLLTPGNYTDKKQDFLTLTLSVPFTIFKVH